jgi:hypothetical protein
VSVVVVEVLLSLQEINAAAITTEKKNFFFINFLLNGKLSERILINPVPPLLPFPRLYKFRASR